MQLDPAQIAPLGDAALRITCAQAPGELAATRVLALDAALREAAWPFIVAVVPAYTTLVVHLDPAQVTLDAAARAIAQLRPAPGPEPSRLWHIPAVYDGVDLPDLAVRLRLPVERLIGLHREPEYRVACLGFAPGFAYLSGLPPELHVPRRPTPRAEIPAGSLILGGQQTAIMPLAMPSGWHILGRTRVALFDPQRAEPALLRPGDRVRFVPVSAADLPHVDVRCEAAP